MSQKETWSKAQFSYKPIKTGGSKLFAQIMDTSGKYFPDKIVVLGSLLFSNLIPFEIISNLAIGDYFQLQN